MSYEPGRVTFAVLGLIAALLLFSHAPSRLLQPELWAEDGKLWLAGAYNDGAACLLQPVVGYLQTMSRLAALLAVHLPLTLAPLLFACVAFMAQLLPALLLLSGRAAKLAPLPVRGLLAFYYIGVPNAFEVYMNLTNAMWHLAVAAFLVVVLAKPRHGAGRLADMALLLVSGLSGPLVLFLAPIAWWHWLARRREAGARLNALYAVVLSACAAIQAGVVATQLAGNRLANLGATFSRCVHILANQIFLGGIIGQNQALRVAGLAWWQPAWPAALVCLLALACLVLAWRQGPPGYRQFVVLAVLIVAGALKSPMISPTLPQWQPMQYPGIGGRYFLVPMLAWFATLLVLAGRGGWLVPRLFARGLILCCALGVAADWLFMPYVHTGYHDAAVQFGQAPAGTTVIFEENPLPWQFTLTKR